MAIPKIIHYCWFGKNKIPKDIIWAIESWKKAMPDYEIILWNESNFNIDSLQWVKEAYYSKKYAFVTDYVRLYAVYNKGGLYLDTDIYILKPFDSFLEYDYFTSLEYDTKTKIFENVTNSDLNDIQSIPYITFQSGLFGGIAGHPYLKDCLKWYEERKFKLSNGKYHLKPIASEIYPAIAQKYGFRYINQQQKLNNNMMILPSKYFSQGKNINITKETYAVHWWEGSWRSNKNWIKKIKSNNTIRKIFRKEPVFNAKEKILKGIEMLNREN